MRRSVVVAIVSAAVLVVALSLAGVFYWVTHYSGNNWEIRTRAAELQGHQLALPPTAAQGLSPRSRQPSTAEGGLSAAQAQELWAPVSHTAAEGHWQAWAFVIDADTGATILDEGAEQAHTPASTTKLLTAITALDTLGFDDRLATTALFAEGTLYLQGQGDLLLSAENGNPSAVNGHAGLADLADQIASRLSEQGVTSFALAYQDDFFGSQVRAPAWKAQEVEDYAGDIGAYAINAGANPSGETQFLADSARNVADQLAELLRGRGFTVTAVTADSTPPARAEQVGSVESAPVGDQIEYLLHKSDNTLAEQYCHLSAGPGATFTTAAAGVISHIASLGIDVSGIELEDCSGLSSNNRISARQLVDVIQASIKDPASHNSLIRLLPRAGINGTMADRLFEEGLAGNVQAKTGSLAEVSTMAGVMTTASGQNLIFAIGADKVPDDGAWATRETIDNFLAALAQS